MPWSAFSVSRTSSPLSHAAISNRRDKVVGRSRSDRRRCGPRGFGQASLRHVTMRRQGLHPLPRNREALLQLVVHELVSRLHDLDQRDLSLLIGRP
jgi:hypothetical protein